MLRGKKSVAVDLPDDLPVPFGEIKIPATLPPETGFAGLFGYGSHMGGVTAYIVALSPELV
jgi:hypothetical protein